MPALSHQRGQSRALKARMTSLVLPGPAAGRRLASGPVCAAGGGIGFVCELTWSRRKTWSRLSRSRRSVPVQEEACQSAQSSRDAHDDTWVEGAA